MKKQANQYFNDKVAVVTGGASGIGRALSIELARKGAIVVIGDINEKGLASVEREINAIGGKSLTVHVDVSDEKSIREFISSIIRNYDRIDLFINNAAVCVTGDLRDITMEHWRKVLNINLLGSIYGSVAAYKVMVKQGAGHIVNVASMAGIAPFGINTPYTASKYGVVGLTRAMYYEGKSLGVRATLVCPGIVKTEFYDTNETVGIEKDAYKAGLPEKVMSAEKAAKIIMRGIEKNKKMILFPFQAKFIWFASRYFPFIITLINKYLIDSLRKLRK